MYLPFIDKTPITLSMSEIVTLNFNMYILTVLTYLVLSQFVTNVVLCNNCRIL